jgi:flagellar biosynthesis/type III secretory pathway protein FliH
LYRGKVIKDESIKIIQLFSFGNMPLFKEEAVAEGEAIDDKITEEPEQEVDEKKIKEIESKAYEEGFTSGEKAGFVKGEERAKVLLDALESLIREMKTIKEQTIKKLEPQVLELAIAIAKRIVIDELTIQPDIIVKIVKESLKKLEKTGKITIKINDSYYDLFIKKKPELIEIYSNIVFEVEPSFPLTRVLVTGALEEIVVDIEEMVKNIAEEIYSTMG